MFGSQCKKYAAVIFSEVGKVLSGWVWGGESLPVSNSYGCLGIECSSDSSWDKHIMSLVVRNKPKIGWFVLS